MTTIAWALPHLKEGLLATENLLKKIPDDVLSFRPNDATGVFQFSIAEILAHMADARTMFRLVYLDGVPFEDLEGSGNFLMQPPEDFEGRSGTWTVVADTLDRATLEKALLRGFEGLHPLMEGAFSTLLEPTKGGQRIYDQAAAKKKEGEQEGSQMVEWGPTTPLRLLFALATHEAQHRGTLITLARSQGVMVHA